MRRIYQGRFPNQPYTTFKHHHWKQLYQQQQARKLQATLEGCNPKLRLTDLLTGVKCRAISVAKKLNPFHPGGHDYNGGKQRLEGRCQELCTQQDAN